MVVRQGPIDLYQRIFYGQGKRNEQQTRTSLGTWRGRTVDGTHVEMLRCSLRENLHPSPFATRAPTILDICESLPWE